MPSESQVADNRPKAVLSTGPRTDCLLDFAPLCLCASVAKT